jgi:hypothetical protein
MMMKRYGLLLALPLVLAACAADEEAEVDTMEMDTTSAPTAAAPMDTGMAGMGGMATTVAMAAVGESGVTGEATLTPSGAQTEVMVRLMGLEPNSTHPGHIHQGTCAAPGAVVAPLQDITADATGAGTMTTTVPVSADSVTMGQHIVAYHGDGGAPVVCGEIRHTM